LVVADDPMHWSPRLPAPLSALAVPATRPAATVACSATRQAWAACPPLTPPRACSLPCRALGRSLPPNRAPRAAHPPRVAPLREERERERVR
jgi:hypothetical protein